MNQIWMNEPDRKEFKHKGLRCLILRIPHSGHLCGYVGVNEAVENEDDYKVHGGITFNKSYIHEPDLFDGYFKEDRYVIGFDCNHTYDLAPKSPYNMRNNVYRDMEYVTAETMLLAEQLKGEL